MPLGGVTYLDVAMAATTPATAAPADLPATTGSGTLAWWVIGGVLLAAVAWLVLKRRSVLTR